MPEVVAVILFVGVIAYACFAGADFGAGFWDLVSGNPVRGARPRALVEDTIGPVWEANHVWLIFVLVVLWTGFPDAFQAVMSTLFIPLTLAAAGIVMRGCGFAFRKFAIRIPQRRFFGGVFALSSVVTPFFLGTVAGAIASGRVPPGNAQGNLVTSWINPTSLLGGVLAVATCAYLAAVFLVYDGRRVGDADLERYFARRAVGAGVAAGAIAVVGVFVLRADSRRLFDDLTTEALPLMIVSALCGGAALALLVRGAHRFTRELALGAVAAVVAGWGVAQYPYVLPFSLTIEQAAAPTPTLAAIVVVFGIAAVTILPSLAFLYVLMERGELETQPIPRLESIDRP